MGEGIRPDVARAEDVRVRLLRLIDDNPSISQRALAEELGLSVGKVNYLIRALVEVGVVKARNFTKSGNKVGYTYFLTPAGFLEKARLTQRFLARKIVEYDSLRTEIETLQKELASRPGAARSGADIAPVASTGGA